MKEQLQTLTADEETTIVTTDEDQTLVAPRFDDEETLVARHVIPLEAVEDGARHAAPSAPSAMRRRWPLALMLASVLIGGVLSGAGLYFYQRHSGDDTAPAASTSQTDTSADASQPAPATEANPTPDARTQETTTNAQTDGAQPAAHEDAKQPATDSVVAAPDSGKAVRTRDAENIPATERRDAPDESRGAVAPKHGKKGEHDEESAHTGRSANRDAPISRAYDHTGNGEARRVDTIIYRPRRAERRDRTRRDTADDSDRLRRIFEGAPE
ncbi:MAG: hypothetical protein QOE46_1920 [Acidobacteriota bacterium]|nr:hypothetical protein [Acidobacteriota bacterium]